MSSPKLFRVYICPKCDYCGYVSLGKETEKVPCPLCTHDTGHKDRIAYTDSLEDARRLVSQEINQDNILNLTVSGTETGG
jgi:uncharacterized protein (DUF2225 family)